MFKHEAQGMTATVAAAPALASRRARGALYQLALCRAAATPRPAPCRESPANEEHPPGTGFWRRFLPG